MYKVPLVFHRNYVSILYCFWDILCQIMAPLYRLHRSSYWHSTELRTYLVSFHCGPILYHFWDREIMVKNRNFCHMTLCLVRPMPSRCVRLSVYRVCALYRNEYTYSQYGSPIILVFFVQNVMAIHRGHWIQDRYEKNCNFLPISCFVSERIQDRATVTMTDLSNGVIFNDLTDPSGPQHCSMSTKMAQGRAILTMEVVYDISNGAIFNDLEWPLMQIVSRATTIRQ